MNSQDEYLLNRILREEFYSTRPKNYFEMPNDFEEWKKGKQLLFNALDNVKIIEKYNKIKAEIESYVRYEEDSADITLSIIKSIVSS